MTNITTHPSFIKTSKTILRTNPIIISVKSLYRYTMYGCIRRKRYRKCTICLLPFCLSFEVTHLTSTLQPISPNSSI